jgi:TfoX/Sxy family transcriptional regulator of competence genes
MPVSPTYRAFVLDQLGRVAEDIRARSMFGGVGIYAGELFFALIDDDTLYLKVDDTNRPDFVAAGMTPFMPFGVEGEVMQYYELPADLLEGGEELGVWVGKAIEVARRAKRTRKKR